MDILYGIEVDCAASVLGTRGTWSEMGRGYWSIEAGDGGGR